MEPFLKNNDKQLFYKYLSNATNYFEYGSGGSTYQASLKANIKKIFSVESDKEWHNKLQTIINDEKIEYLYVEMDTKPNTWGHPGNTSTKEQWINYSDQILKIKSTDEIDLIMIDGRFRVACCLKCFDKINENTYIMFDDFLDRKPYHIVLEYYDIIEKTTDNSMVILKKKKNIKCVNEEHIKKYELIRG